MRPLKPRFASARDTLTDSPGLTNPSPFPPDASETSVSATETYGPVASTAGALEQATALRIALRDAVNKTSELIRTLKREQKQSKLVRSTLASLKQIQAVEV